MNNVVISKTQQIFVDALIDGHGQTESARKAGYGDGSDSDKLVRSVAVRKEYAAYARAITRGKIDIIAAPAAYRVLMELLHAEDTAKSLKADIAKFLINHSVPAPKALDEGGEKEKDISEMTREELQALIRETDEAMVKRGIMIDATPAQAFDDII